MNDSRFESIGGLLKPRPTPAQPVGATLVEDPPPASTRSAPPAEARPAKIRDRRQGSAAPSMRVEGLTRRVAVRLDPTLHDLLVARADADSVTKGDAVLDAIEATYPTGQLAEALAVGAKNVGESGMFRRSRRTATRPQPTVMVEVRLHPDDLEQLDRLVTELHAESRTALLTAALTSYLQ